MRSRRASAVVAIAFASLAPALWTTTATAGVAWDESVSGDLSNNELAPTLITLLNGDNTLAGTMTATGDTRDFITFTLGPGQQLAALKVMAYTDIATGGPGARGFHAINAGATSFVPSPSTAASFLGGNHLDPVPVGTDVLPKLGTTPIAGSGFSIPLGPGTYSYLVQQTGPEVTGYTLDFVVIPAPGAMALAGVAGLAVARRRR